MNFNALFRSSLNTRHFCTISFQLFSHRTYSTFIIIIRFIIRCSTFDLMLRHGSGCVLCKWKSFGRSCWCVSACIRNSTRFHTSFLTALNMQSESLTRSGLNQAKPSNQMSETIWGTLRMAISLSGRIDLQPSIDDRNLGALNSAFNLNMVIW